MDSADVPNPLPNRVLRYERAAYRGKHYLLPIFDTDGAIVLRAQPERATAPSSPDGHVVASIHGLFDIHELRNRPRRPASLGILSSDELDLFTKPGAVCVLDMPIKMPDCAEYRLPCALSQFAPTIQRIIDVEHSINPHHADYFAYLTIDQAFVHPEQLHREAPCHVDGFQGQRWHPRCRTNHSYTVSDVLPTAYYVQPFDLTMLDERVHDFFWEMNAQVADTNEAFRWQPEPGELTVMDCYCVHRGIEATQRLSRTWLRLSFEERRRIFDRLGNAHNPLFDYAWEMVERDIEQLGLRPYRAQGDPSHNVFHFALEVQQFVAPQLGEEKKRPARCPNRVGCRACRSTVRAFIDVRCSKAVEHRRISRSSTNSSRFTQLRPVLADSPSHAMRDRWHRRPRCWFERELG